MAKSYVCYLLKAQLPSEPSKLQIGFSPSVLKVKMSILQRIRALTAVFSSSGSEWPSVAAVEMPWRSKHLAN